ncbi:ArsA family ATPase [Candidatus Methanomassiliicoccus intestinalis]|jgi:arsenite-activated ATPase arsA|uniref:Putative arsenical pump-driving ATPase n=1 Tax=Candidatus Methanomassiliicoccus intestinalis TaxID=1406512 RepID=A0A8J8PH09_9ARCH|nr:MAG: arsenical pump-driving ATPase [Candidatus Methanomassiliicoccus intestinalis]TQS84088.1 MAG: arsenical pump-driving ATPase [Candidatus Methanomassiliicoccus intestinalis]
MRLIIYTGKGGVGKTSVAAATALKCARKGYKTLIMSTDAAHSVSDSMETELCGQPTRVEENLDAIEIDMLYELETRWSEIQKYISDFLVSQGLDGITSKEMSVIPGMELMSALFYLDDFHKKGTYDVIVMDTAPTGETIKLLSFPESSEWYSDKLYRIIHNLIKVARMTIGKVMSTPLPSEELLKDLEMLIGRMKNVQKILEDPEITSIRLVVNPEKMVINETKRAYTYLCLYGLTVECLVINRLLPDGNDDYFAQKRIEQEKYMKIIQESFDPLKMLKAQQLPVELVGMKSLEYLGDMLFQDEDPTSRFTTERPIEIYSENGKDIIALRLPFMPKEKVQLYKSSDSLVVEAGQYRRSMSLPFTFIQKEPEKAEFTDGMLRIMFPGDDVSGEQKPAE